MIFEYIWRKFQEQKDLKERQLRLMREIYDKQKEIEKLSDNLLEEVKKFEKKE